MRARRGLLQLVCPADHILVRVVVSRDGKAVVVVRMQVPKAGRGYGRAPVPIPLEQLQDNDTVRCHCACHRSASISAGTIRGHLAAGRRRVVIP